MPSDKQLAANRKNSQRSTGPRTTEGKVKSSANALTTGLYAESQIIKGESSADFDALTADYYSEYHPTTPSQRALVDTLINNEWLLRRLRRVESDLWNKGIEFLEESHYQPKNHLISDAFNSKQETMARLQRRIDSFDRAFHRALKALRQLQAAESEAEAIPEPAQPIGPQLVTSQIGFLPSPSHTPIPEPPQATFKPFRPSPFSQSPSSR